MKVNYLLHDITVGYSDDVNNLNTFLKELFNKNVIYLDEIVINLFVENELLMRNNVIVDCLLKALREKETGISQSFDDLYKNEMEELIKLDVEKHYEKKTLVRETMDDFAMI